MLPGLGFHIFSATLPFLPSYFTFRELSLASSHFHSCVAAPPALPSTASTSSCVGRSGTHVEPCFCLLKNFGKSLLGSLRSVLFGLSKLSFVKWQQLFVPLQAFYNFMAFPGISWHCLAAMFSIF